MRDELWICDRDVVTTPMNADFGRRRVLIARQIVRVQPQHYRAAVFREQILRNVKRVELSAAILNDRQTAGVRLLRADAAAYRVDRDPEVVGEDPGRVRQGIGGPEAELKPVDVVDGVGRRGPNLDREQPFGLQRADEFPRPPGGEIVRRVALRLRQTSDELVVGVGIGAVHV